MSLTAIVSYDGTPNDNDALTLARVFSDAGAKLVLAYVRHTAASRYRGGEQLAEDEASALLDRGVATLDSPAETRVVVHGKTSEGLRALADAENAQLIVFGSEYRTPANRVAPQLSTQALYENGPTAIAIAPASYTEKPIRTIGLLAGLDDRAAIDTAHGLATRWGAEVTDKTHNVDLLIVGSRKEAQTGKVMLSSQAQNAIDGATAPVLVVTRDVALTLPAPTPVQAA